eukprot:239582-Chlamydomonas_euryale.AAC.1
MRPEKLPPCGEGWPPAAAADAAAATAAAAPSGGCCRGELLHYPASGDRAVAARAGTAGTTCALGLCVHWDCVCTGA